MGVYSKSRMGPWRWSLTLTLAAVVRGSEGASEEVVSDICLMGTPIQPLCRGFRGLGAPEENC